MASIGRLVKIICTCRVIVHAIDLCDKRLVQQDVTVPRALKSHKKKKSSMCQSGSGQLPNGITAYRSNAHYTAGHETM